MCKIQRGREALNLVKKLLLHRSLVPSCFSLLPVLFDGLLRLHNQNQLFIKVITRTHTHTHKVSTNTTLSLHLPPFGEHVPLVPPQLHIFIPIDTLVLKPKSTVKH